MAGRAEGGLDDVDSESDDDDHHDTVSLAAQHAVRAAAEHRPFGTPRAPPSRRRAAAVFAPGSRGDVEPLLAVALRLAEVHGFRVTLACHRCFEEEVRERAGAAGVAFAPIAGDPAKGRGAKPMRGEEAEATWNSQMRDYRAAAEGADVIMFNFFGVMAYHLAEAMQKPCLALWLVPFTRTRAFPAYLVSGSTAQQVNTREKLKAQHGDNWVVNTHLLWEAMFYQPFASKYTRFREYLGLSPLQSPNHFQAMYLRRVPVLYGFSRAVVPRPRDWPANVQVVGYFSGHEVGGGGEDWEAPPELDAFVRGEPGETRPLVYVGFGSAVGRSPAEDARTLIAACRQAGARAVVATGLAGGLDPGDAERGGTKDVHVVSFVPHGWLLPRVDAALHHGGAGTTGSCFRAGVPQVVCPIEYDQPYWAERAQELGVAPAPIPAENLTTRAAEKCLRWALAEGPRARAKELAAEIEATQEGGAVAAAGFIDTFMAFVEDNGGKANMWDQPGNPVGFCPPKICRQ